MPGAVEQERDSETESQKCDRPGREEKGNAGAGL